MSTPKPAKEAKPWDLELLSPIVGSTDRLSESDLSSTSTKSSGDYTTGRSSLSKVSSTNSERGDVFQEEEIPVQPVLLSERKAAQVTPRGINTITDAINSIETVKNNLRGSYTSLLRIPDIPARAPVTNLKTTRTDLKNSYPNLRGGIYTSNLKKGSDPLKLSEPNLVMPKDEVTNLCYYQRG